LFGLGTTELLLILAIVVVLFGATRIPKLATGLGRAINGFRKALGGEPDERP
jgi:sec-independent protein translocase protein TatA